MIPIYLSPTRDLRYANMPSLQLNKPSTRDGYGNDQPSSAFLTCRIARGFHSPRKGVSGHPVGENVGPGQVKTRSEDEPLVFHTAQEAATEQLQSLEMLGPLNATFRTSDILN